MTGTLATSRIEALTDGVFAIAMTLLIYLLTPFVMLFKPFRR